MLLLLMQKKEDLERDSQIRAYKCLNVGLDETNNGIFPTIYVSVFSDRAEDQNIFVGNEFSKYRKSHKKLMDKLEERQYSYLLLVREDNELIQPYKKVGVVLGSLVKDKKIEDNLKVYVDGIIPQKTADYAYGILKDMTGLAKSSIQIYSGKDLDRKNKLVNLADELAHSFLYRTINSMREDKHYKQLIIPHNIEFY
jgi:hypothetical protein